MVVSMDRWVGKAAIVTGASSGIGAAVCKHLVGYGLQVAGLARRKELMDKLAKNLEGKKGKLHPIKTDVTKEKEILDAFKWVKDNLGPIHILINNAGSVHPANLTTGATEMWKADFNVNVLALLIATREAVKDMRANKVDGHIVHINSITGHKVPNMPSLNIYPATKFAVTALTESLRLELNTFKSRIKISSVSPGATNTEFVKNVDSDKQISNTFKTLLKTEDVASAVVYVLSTPPSVQIHELTIKPMNEPF